jgi:hypothetical protein
MVKHGCLPGPGFLSFQSSWRHLRIHKKGSFDSTAPQIFIKKTDGKPYNDPFLFPFHSAAKKSWAKQDWDLLIDIPKYYYHTPRLYQIQEYYGGYSVPVTEKGYYEAARRKLLEIVGGLEEYLKRTPRE